jgi:hypothetical protein
MAHMESALDHSATATTPKKIVQMMLHTKFQSSKTMVLDKKIFKFFLYESIKQCDPSGEAIFDPREMIWIILVEGH